LADPTRPTKSFANKAKKGIRWQSPCKAIDPGGMNKKWDIASHYLFKHKYSFNEVKEVR
jgi:hypothetical protein